MRPRIERLDARCAELGWQLDFLHPGWLTEELLPVFARLRCSFTIAHMGMFRAEAGPQQPGFRKLIDLLRHGEADVLGEAHRHLSHGDRADLCRRGADGAALIEAAPDRLIWGSDYPHLSFADKVGSVQLFNLLADWAPDEATRRRILLGNPPTLV